MARVATVRGQAMSRPTNVTPQRARGAVVELTAHQREMRMRYLAGLVRSDALDPAVRFDSLAEYQYVKPRPPTTSLACLPMFYLLKFEHEGEVYAFNGGVDPTAPDPATRWIKPDDVTRFINRTCDCIGGMSWAGGFDRLQVKRFPFNNGYVNTDSMRMDARA